MRQLLTRLALGASLLLLSPQVPNAQEAPAGNPVMVQIQSSWFSPVDRNPQKFMDIGRATDADFVKATHKVHRGSSVTLSVVP